MSLTFPQHFKFGVADADIQTIGESNTLKNEDSQPTMWNYFAKNSGRCYQNHTPEIGIDRYHMWKNDIEIMKTMGVQNYRTSVSMARLLRKNGDVNPKAVSWYKEYFKSLNRAGIKIYATLYHWELPQHLSELGGWKNLKTADYLTKHALAVLENLGEYIEEYFLFNESRHASIRSYYEGQHAPGEKNLKGALQAAHNILIAQAMAFNALISKNKDLKIGTVLALSPSYANTTKKEDLLAAKYSDGAKNLWFMDPIYLGKYPDFMLEVYKDYLPEIKEKDMEFVKIGTKLHSIGINYYKGAIVEWTEEDPRHFSEIKIKGGPVNDLGWPIYLPPTYPEGLFDLINQIYFSYKNFGLKHLYITETGTALKNVWDKKSEVINDEKRVIYFRGHVEQVYKALQRGIPIEGFFAWTFMDNYEWPEGYKDESRFGLIYVDRSSMKRVMKKSALWYSGLIKTKNLL